MNEAERLRNVRTGPAYEPLARLIGFAVAAELETLRGRYVDPDVLEAAAAAAREAIDKLADAGALLYFDIRDRFDLGGLPSEVRTLMAKTCPTCRRHDFVIASPWDYLCGHSTVDAYTLASIIINRSLGAGGWKRASEISADDLKSDR